MSLEISQLSVSATKQPILSNLSFSMNSGTLLAVLGPSGSGKTTLIRTILGLTQHLSICGEIRFEGQLLQQNQQTPLSRKARRFAYIPQHLSLWPHLSVQQTLSLSARWSKQHDQAFMNELLELLNLTVHLKRKPQELSGGEQQKLALARALIAKPRLIVFDEPLSALDVVAKAQVINHIKLLQTKFNFTGLLITHDLPEALMLAHEILILIRGQKFWQGPKNLIHQTSFPSDWQLLSSPLLSQYSQKNIHEQG